VSARAHPVEVIAHYSIPKVAAWVLGVSFVSATVLLDGASHGWRMPEGRYASLFPEAVVGAVIGLVFAAGFILTFTLSRGAAIAKVGDAFILYYPLLWRRVIPVAGVEVSATSETIDASMYAPSWFRVPSIVADQITLHRPGQRSLTFRTGLLREDAKTIAQRIQRV
jgi:hypothetical protein